MKKAPAFLVGLLLGLCPLLFGASTSTDVIDGVSASTAIKAPVRSVVTTNITTSGLSAISTLDGSLTPADGERWLLAGQTSGVNNGIYVSRSGSWERAQDFDGTRDARDGTLVIAQTGYLYQLTTSDPIVIGTSSLAFSRIDGLALAADPEIAALTSVTSAADKLFYFTGSGTGAVNDFSAFGRTLVDDAAATNARTTLGVVIGTDVQAYDADLGALAGVTSAADALPYFTGAGTATTTTLTTFARTVLDDASASTARTTLGCVNIAGDTFTGDVLLPTAGPTSTLSAGFRGMPQNAQNAVYEFVLADAGKHIFHDEVSARTYTIPANASVAFPIGTVITIVNNNGAGTITLAITSDTLRRGDGTAGTGSRTIAADRVVTIIKTKTTEWVITGSFT